MITARWSLYGAVLAGCMAVGSSAQEPPLRPLSQHLEQGEPDDSASLHYVASRCSVLFSLVGVQRGNRGDRGSAEMYTDWAIGFQTVALRTATEAAGTTQEALSEIEEDFERIRGVLDERMRRSMAGGNRYGYDPLIASDVRTCRDLVDQLRL